jgi:hypothetical protein
MDIIMEAIITDTMMIAAAITGITITAAVAMAENIITTITAIIGKNILLASGANFSAKRIK